jgi:hypothetical protein
MGRVYVSDFRSRLWVLTESGDPLEFWDYYSLYGGIALDPYGNVVISGYKILARSPVFLVEGPAVWVLSRDGRQTARYDLGVYSIAAGPRGTFYGVRVAYDGEGNPYSSIVHFTSGGTILRTWPYATESSIYDNIAVDAEGFIYVVERPSYRVTKFASDGRRLVSWTETGGSHSNFSWPVALAVDAGLSIYVSDFWNDRVVKFSPPAEP